MNNKLYNNISFPNSKNENWRYFNLQELKIKLDKIKNSKSILSIFNNYDIESHLKIDDKGIFINKNLPQGITIDIINNKDLKLLDEKIKKNIGKIASVDNDYFVSENNQIFNELVIIKVKENTNIKSDLKLDINISKNIKFIPRFFIYAEKESRSSIEINWDINFCSINSVFEVYLKNKAQLDFVITNNGQNSIDIFNYSFQLEKESNLKTTFISLGNQIVKNDIRINLIDKKAHADIGGLYIAKSNSTIDYNIKMNHLSKETSSKQIFKGILNENSKVSFTGLVKIEKDCVDCKSEQINNNLLLSEKAQINSDPQLEIYCNDVECSHGSTVGQFDDDILFYIRSRGIPEKYAKKMLLEAFYMDILNRVNNPKTKSVIENSI